MHTVDRHAERIDRRVSLCKLLSLLAALERASHLYVMRLELLLTSGTQRMARQLGIQSLTKTFAIGMLINLYGKIKIGATLGGDSNLAAKTQAVDAQAHDECDEIRSDLNEFFRSLVEAHENTIAFVNQQLEDVRKQARHDIVTIS